MKAGGPKFDTKSRVKGGEIRKHYFLDRYIVVAPLRGKRPDAFAEPQSHKTESYLSPAIEKEKSILEIKDSKGWTVKVIENKFPALSLDNPAAFGKQEMVIETPFHNQEFSELSLAHIEKIFDAYKLRVKALQQVEGVAYVAVFKNDGPKAGATLAHAHSQIVALPLIPPVVETEAVAFDQYRMHHGTCPICDIIAWEKQEKERIVFENDHLIAICPYAGSAPYGVWVIPKHHKGTFGELSESELHSTAEVLKLISGQLDKYGISFNFFLQDSLPEQNHHFVLKVEPRPNVWGGLEISTGVIINPVPPEFATNWYKSNR